MNFKNEEFDVEKYLNSPPPEKTVVTITNINEPNPTLIAKALLSLYESLLEKDKLV